MQNDKLAKGIRYYQDSRYDDALARFVAVLETDPENAEALQYKGASLRALRRYAEAERVLTEARPRHPQHSGILGELASLYATQGRYEQAIATFDEMLAIDAQSEWALENKALCLRLLRRFAEAEQLLDAALARFPHNTGLMTGLGLAYFRQGRYDAAIAILDDVLKSAPENASALEYKIASLRRSRRFAEAESLLNAVRATSPGNLRFLSEQGFLYYDLDRYPEAIAAFDQILAREPENESALEFKAISLRRSRRFGEAESLLNGARAKYPGNLRFLSEQGLLYYDLDRYTEANAAFELVLSSEPENASATKFKGASLRLLREFTAAESFLAAARVTFPQDLGILLEWGYLNYDRARYPEAIAAFGELLERDPANASALEYSAASLRLSRKFAEAERVLTEALAKHPENVRILNERGFLQYDLGRLAEAMAVFDQVLKRDPENASALEFKAASLRRSRRFAEAQSVLAEARKKLPQNVAILNEQGFVHADQGRYAEAIITFSVVLAADPANAIALEFKAVSLRLLRKFEEAQAVLAEARAKLPDNVRLLNEQGLLYSDQRRYDEAIATFESASKLQPDNADTYFNWGCALGNQRRISEALEKYAEAKALDRTYWQADHNIADAYWSQGCYSIGRVKWKQARFTYESLAEAKRGEADAFFFFYFGGILHEVFGDFQRARQMFETGRNADPSNPFNSLGLAYLFLAERDATAGSAKALAHSSAWSEYKRAERLIAAPLWYGNPDTVRQFAELQLAIRDLDGAEKNLKLAKDADPDSAAIVADFGILCTARNDYSGAKAFFETAKSRNPYDLTIRTNLAEAYLKSNELSAAEAEFKEIVTVTEEHVEAWFGLGEVYTAMADAGDRDLYDDAIAHFSRGIKLATGGAGKRIPPNKIAAAYYSCGYARVKAAESSRGPDGDHGLQGALNDFQNCHARDRANHKAARAKEKLRQRLNRFAPARVGELVSSAIITLFAIVIFAAVQSEFYFGHTPTAVPASGEAKAGAVVERSRIGEASYVVLTFGTVLLMVTGLYLPRILKLKFGSIELEKSAVEQIAAPTTLGISK